MTWYARSLDPRGLFSAEMWRKCPHHSAVHLHPLSSGKGFWSHVPQREATSVHDWGQLCRFEGKTCAHFRTFTSSSKRDGKITQTGEERKRLCRTDRACFPAGARAGKARGATRALTLRIYKNGAQPSASGAVSQVANGCAVQHSGQLCRFEGKNGRTFRAFTT